MSDQPQYTIADRFEAYLLGHLDDKAMDQLEDALRAEPNQADDCIEVMATLAMVREQFRDQYQQSDELRKDPTLHDFHDLLSELSAMEAAAEAQTVQWVGQVKTGRPIWQQWPIVIPSGIAALLAIAVVLIVALPTGNTAPTSPQIANDLRDPNEPGPVDPALTDIVATLTAERDAQWGGAALAAPAPGSALRAGDRLTLTQGFAEITTHDGAIAILEAPATVELIDNDNALRLHAGKLVGICETESSKGFVVRTPHMDITDLGTRFGIRVQPDRTETTVLVGEVLVKTPSGEARRITHSQTARLDLDRPEQTLIVESRVAQGYIQQIPRPSLITDATLNLEGYALRVVPQGMREDAKVFTDRDYEVNGIDETGIPAFLLGGDLIMMPSDARPGINAAVGDRLQVEVEVSQPAEIYLLIEQSRKVGPWLERDYEKTEFIVGNDRVSPDLRHESLGIGPGVSIDRHFEVWKRKVPITRRTVVGEAIDRTMYAIVATPLSNNNDLLN